MNVTIALDEIERLSIAGGSVFLYLRNDEGTVQIFSYTREPGEDPGNDEYNRARRLADAISEITGLTVDHNKL